MKQDKRLPTMIFDCDGTLLKSLGLGMESYNYALEKVGARPHGPEEIKCFFGTSSDKIFRKLLGDSAQAQKAYEYFFEYETKLVPKILLHDGIRDLLTKLQSSGVRMGLVTGRHSREINLFFDHHKLFGFFETLVCDDLLTTPKPAPEGILLACANMKVDPKTSFYIGDAVMDMRAARGAGATPVAALWDDWARKAEMEVFEPALLARTPEEIWSWFEKTYLR